MAKGNEPQAIERYVTPQVNNGFDQGKPDEWEEITGPVQFKFEKVGDKLIGQLRSMERIAVKGKEAIRYVLDLDGKAVEFLGTWDLDRKILPSHRGMMLRITFNGVDESMGRDGNPLKLFKVEAKKSKVNGLLITDDDLPESMRGGVI